jgi:hypothetical protein
MSLEKFPLGDLEAFCESLIRDCPDRGNVAFAIVVLFRTVSLLL